MARRFDLPPDFQLSCRLASESCSCVLRIDGAPRSRGVRSLPREAVGRLVELADERRKIEVEIDDTVRAARNAGARWEDTGGALGMTRPGASKRYR